MQNWFNNLNSVNTILFVLLLDTIGVTIIYLKLNGIIPVGYFIGIGLVIESFIILYKKYIVSAAAKVKLDKKKSKLPISDEVANAMASKIKFEAEQHRKKNKDF
tara:strand:- start:440 stop:751 length:312 start_codon:yes stop_codon:yes gene_type:complete